MQQPLERTESLTPATRTRDDRGPAGFEATGAAARLGTLKPRSVGELLDVTIDIVRDRFLGLLLPAFLLSLVGTVLSLPLQDLLLANEVGLGAMSLAIVIGSTQMLLALIVQWFVSAVAYDVLIGRSSTVRERWPIILRRMPALLGVSVIFWLALCAGILTLGLMTIIFGWKLRVALQVALIEGRGPFDALSRSWTLTRGSLVRVAGLWIVTYLLFLPLSEAGGSLLLWADGKRVPEMFAAIGPEAFRITALGLVALLGALPMLFAGVLWTAYYFDLVVRFEGRDLQLWMDRRAREAHGEFA